MLLGALVLQSCAVLAADATLFDQLVRQLPRDPHEEMLGARMMRTMALLATSTPDHRRPVTILMYGQSISHGLKESGFEKALREKFPHADLTYLNTSISGFSASQLVRSAANDIYPLDPDLVLLNDYGSTRIEFERILENIRRYTTAEILLWTHHVGGNTSPGALRNDENEAAAIRYLAQKYNCELADVREEWKAYLEANKLAPKDLLGDEVHPNAKGRDLLAAMLLKHFRLNPSAPAGWTQMVRTYEAKRQPDEGSLDGIVFTGKPWRFLDASAIGENRASALKLTFRGSRADCVLTHVDGLKPGTATMRIDGRAPSTINELWAHTIPSPAFGTDWQPAIRRVSHNKPLVPETWKLVVTKINEDASRFSFGVYGSKTGFDGGGEFDGRKYRYGPWGDMLDYAGTEPYPDVFVSKSGRVVIDYRDFKIPWARTYSKKPCPEGFEVKWEAVPLFTETLTSPSDAAPGKIRMITLAKGLPNGTHTVEIIPNGDGAVAIESIEVHEPPLK